MKKITVLIVDDSAVIRSVFREMLSSQPDIEVLDTAVDPYDAREKIKALNPQVLTLDIEMPKMDGLSFLEKIMSLRPMPVIMASTLTQKGADTTIRALEIGAVDYISKPQGNHNEDTLEHLKEELIHKVRAAAGANITHRRHAGTDTTHVVPFTPNSAKSYLIAIGSSTGGVEALREIFIRLPKNCPPIVITQHMPAQFTRSFAARLNTLSQVEVCEAQDGMKILPGHAYLAPGGEHHLRVVKSGLSFFCRLVPGAPVSGHRPSVDTLFQSVSETVGSRAVGVILTGMGGDGAMGMLAMREQGAYTIGQNKSTCVVYGMPKVAHEKGAVHIELPLHDIPKHILAYCEQRGEVANAV